MTDVEAFRWVDEDHQRQLESSSTSAWGSAWPEYLGRYLDHTWSSWQQESDDTLREWLRERIDAVALGWVTATQQSQLGTLTDRGDWREWLPRQLDEWWADWAKASPGELTAWLDGGLASLLPADETAEPAFDARELTWVTPSQSAALEAYTPERGDWRTWLPGQLDIWWPDWTTASPDDLTPWLDNALPSLPPPGPQQDARALTWVTPELVERLDAMNRTKGDWHDWLPGQLDIWWPDWTTASPDNLVPWLVTALAGLEPADEPADQQEQAAAPNAEPQPDQDLPAAADPRSFEWLTEEQLTQLNELYEIRGDWHDWLGDELDRRRPDWPTLPPGALVAWLNDVIGLLALPESDDFLDAVLGALEQDEEMLELAASLSPDELAQVLDDVLSTIAA
ncbi:hypothetical protein FB561_0459 [Kribbella amoyensis]|uniref:Uncharacterized protein n=1 Tax=Kribbella amoyensis TaxID=996641 RepID=A0A561BKL2_9ACTN|nr:hypothetical protein [Kribbella amoyensis]TWD79401.1 hypothetical protein FB561_0459 [Kribbella amoyensis]